MIGVHCIHCPHLKHGLCSDDFSSRSTSTHSYLHRIGLGVSNVLYYFEYVGIDYI